MLPQPNHINTGSNDTQENQQPAQVAKIGELQQQIQIHTDAQHILASLGSVQRQFTAGALASSHDSMNAFVLSASIMQQGDVSLHEELLENPFDSEKVTQLLGSTVPTPFVAEAIAMGDPRLLNAVRNQTIGAHLTLNQIDALAERVVKLKGAIAECSADDARKSLGELFDILKSKVLDETPPRDALVKRETYLYLIRATRMISDAKAAIDLHAGGLEQVTSFLEQSVLTIPLQHEVRAEWISGAVIVRLDQRDFHRIAPGNACVIHGSQLGCLSGRIICAPYDVSESTLRHEYEHVLFNHLFTTETIVNPLVLADVVEMAETAAESLDEHTRCARLASRAAKQSASNELAAYSTQKSSAFRIGSLGFDTWLDSLLPSIAQLVDAQPITAERKREIYSVYADTLMQDVRSAHFQNGLLSYRARMSGEELKEVCSDDMVTALFQVIPDDHPDKLEFLSKLITGMHETEIPRCQEERAKALVEQLGDSNCGDFFAVGDELSVLAPTAQLYFGLSLLNAEHSGLDEIAKDLVKAILPQLDHSTLQYVLEISPVPPEVPSPDASALERKGFENAVWIREEIAKFACNFDDLVPLKIAVKKLCGENTPLASESDLNELARLMRGHSAGTWKRVFPLSEFRDACKSLPPELIIRVGSQLASWCPDPSTYSKLIRAIVLGTCERECEVSQNDLNPLITSIFKQPALAWERHALNAMCLLIGMKLGRTAYFNAIPSLLQFCPSQIMRRWLLTDVVKQSINLTTAEKQAREEMLAKIEARLNNGAVSERLLFPEDYQGVISKIRDWIEDVRLLN